MVRSYKDFKPSGVSFSPVSKDANLKSIVVVGRPEKSDTINNNIELMISPQQELSKFVKLLILLLICLQSVLLIVFTAFLYSKIVFLESEVSMLTQLTTMHSTHISGIKQEMYNVREEYQDTLSLDVDCRLLSDVNTTDFEKEFFLLDIDVQDEDDDNVERTEEEVEDVKREKRQSTFEKVMKRKNQLKKQQGRQNKKNQRRLVCHKCKTIIGNRVHNKSNILLTTPKSLQSADVASIHFNGGLPEVLVREKGTIGPWFYDSSALASKESVAFKLEKNSTVTVLTDGFYFIYAQVYYLTSGGSNSYSIIKHQRIGYNGEILATCSSGSSSSNASQTGQEVSCFTATVGHLRRGDNLYLTEREKDRRVLFRDGQTYFGLVKLSSAVRHNPVNSLPVSE